MVGFAVGRFDVLGSWVSPDFRSAWIREVATGIGCVTGISVDGCDEMITAFASRFGTSSIFDPY